MQVTIKNFLLAQHSIKTHITRVHVWCSTTCHRATLTIGNVPNISGWSQVKNTAVIETKSWSFATEVWACTGSLSVNRLEYAISAEETKLLLVSPVKTGHPIRDSSSPPAHPANYHNCAIIGTAQKTKRCHSEVVDLAAARFVLQWKKCLTWQHKICRSYKCFFIKPPLRVTQRNKM